MSLKQGQLIHNSASLTESGGLDRMPFKECESWAYFCAMNNPFVELPDVRFKKMLNSVCETK